MNLSLVIPLYNESARISILEQGLLDFIKNCNQLTYEIILVNDCSTDDTEIKLRDVRKRLLEIIPDNCKKISIVKLKSNIEKGGSLREGVLMSEGQWILTLDADMATSPMQLLEWCNNDKYQLNVTEELSNEVFVGSREHPDSIVDDKVTRKFTGRIFNFLVQIINGINLNDTQCGFKLYPAKVAKSIFGSLRDFGWAHDVELLKRAKRDQVNIVEMPVKWKAVGKSKINPMLDSFPMLFSILKLEGVLFRERLIRTISINQVESKTVYNWASALLLLLMVGVICFIFQDYGITWDEDVQNSYGGLVWKYYSTFFENKGSYSHGNLYLYGGLFDSVAAMLSEISPFGVFETRHFLNAFVGLFGIVGAWKLADLLAGPKAAFFTGVLLLLVPSYFGHMFNNPKDIPFATGYVWSLYYSIYCLRYFPRIPNGLIFKLGVMIGLTLAVRVGGMLLFGYLGLAALLYAVFPDWFGYETDKTRRPAYWMKTLFKSYVGVFLLAYIIMLIFWPWAQRAPFSNPFKALTAISNFDWGGDVLLAGQYVNARNLPQTYLLKYFSVKMPEIVLIGLGLSIIMAGYFIVKKKVKPYKLITNQYAFLVFATLFPVVYVIAKKAVLYDAIRHFLFIVPLLCVISGVALERTTSILCLKKSWCWSKIVANTSIVTALLVQLYLIVQLHPNQYVYYNSLAGGVKGADGKYEMDYWGNSYKEAVGLMVNYLKEVEADQFQKREYLVNVCGPVLSASYYLPENFRITDNVKEADFFISFTRSDCHKSISGKKIASVNRMGAELSVVKDLRFLD